MMGKGTGLGWLIGAAIGLMLSPSLAADEGQSTPPPYWDGVARKFGRGVTNIATGPLELIRTPYLVSEQDGGLAGLTVGLAQGVKAMVVRELAGVYETTTFFLPIPRDFRPLVQPEFVYAHGDWAP